MSGTGHSEVAESCKPFCPVFGQCGGCTLQHLSYPAQLEFKGDFVRREITAQCRGNIEFLPVIGMTRPFEYRNKVQYPIGKKEGKPLIGFYAPHSWEIIENSVCTIQHPEADIIKDILKAHMAKYKVSIYDRRKDTGYFRYLMTRKAFATGEIMVIFVARGDKFPGMDELIPEIVKAVPAVKSIVMNINKKPGAAILGREETVIYGKATISDKLCGFDFEISARSFYQVNPPQAEILYKVASEFADIKPYHIVMDLYSGIGTFSLIAARNAAKVYGIEINHDAVADAERNCERNGIKNTIFITGRTENAVWKALRDGIKPDVVILNPPRTGCEEGVISALVMRQIPKVVYISCDPATLGRDLGMLEKGGFRIEKIQPVDMFPHTAHIESAALAVFAGKTSVKSS